MTSLEGLRNPGTSLSVACPVCGCTMASVMDTRASHGGIRRRRRCADCLTRYTTYESIPAPDPLRPALRKLASDMLSVLKVLEH